MSREMIAAHKKYWWKISLELKLRKFSGDSFQDFFSTMMAVAHGSDFVRVRAFGALGDKGCDGYLQSSGKVFACYGAINSASQRVRYLIQKMEDDFAKASASLATIMREWHMVHNLVDGLPIDALIKLEELKAANQVHRFGFLGLEGFEEIIFALDETKIEALLGMAAGAQDTQNLQTGELRHLINAVMSATDVLPVEVGVIRPVPPGKLVFNNLPGHWRAMIAGGWQNAHLVEDYISTHHDPLLGQRIGKRFRTRYEYFRAQGLEPGTIMTALYEDVTGVGVVQPATQVAAQALLAHLFESCDIFEEPPLVQAAS